jgi:two-component system nitrogen regulation sensor histidine kinase NtrY
VFQPGYSELLLDKKYHGYARLRDYSFAKYINGKIVFRNGEFPYDETDAAYVEESPDYRFFKSEGFKHILYKNGNATVLISRPEVTPADIIISFAYLFAFILLFFNLLLLIVRRPELKNV